jgi:hypothetical protein
VRISLDSENFAYAQMLNAPEYAFFDARDLGGSTAQHVAIRPVIFRLWVMRTAHGSGRWQKVGDAPIQAMLERPALRFNQDPVDPRVIVLTEDGFSGPRVTVKECQGYERAAVWDASHVEDRLRDYFAGTSNKWVELMRPRVPEAT